MKQGKKIKEAKSKVDKTVLYNLDEAVQLMNDVKIAKFDETVEVAIKVVHKSDQNIRGSVTLPHGTGKEVKVLVICKGGKQDEAKEAGADYVGAEDIIEKIKDGWIDFQAGFRLIGGELKSDQIYITPLCFFVFGQHFFFCTCMCFL